MYPFDPQLGLLARLQLTAWQDLARGWQVDDAGKCAECGKGVYLVTDSAGAAYRYTDAEQLALVVLHLRNHHADLDPDKGL